MTTLSLGILSWKGYASLRRMLESLSVEGFSELFDERLIFFPEIDDEAGKIASDFGFVCRGSEKNLGIFGGFRALAESLTGDHVLLLENDLHLIEPVAEVKRQLSAGRHYLETGNAKVVLMRHRRQAGQDFDGIRKFRQFFPDENAGLPARIQAALLRTLRSDKAERLIGNAPYALEKPETRFPQLQKDAETGFLLTGPRHRAWTNQSILIERRFFIETILDRVENARTTRRVNGFKNIEIEMNDTWWRSKDWKIAIAPGLFTHQREGHRGY